MRMLEGRNMEVHSLTKAGVVFLLYLFLVLVIYFALSTPVEMLFDAFESADFAGAETQKDTYMPVIRTACTIFFSILVSIPVAWFFFWIFHREPSYQETYPGQYWRE